MQSVASDEQELIARLNAETAKIGWHELQKHYASGNVLAVSPHADLIKVAMALHRDHTEQIKTWLASGDVVQVSDQQALDWYNQASILWALVIPPFVLVQETIKKEG